jgi:outer membrane protein assembly factor BamB
MSKTTERTAVSLGEVEPARSRHAGRRSAVALTDDAVVTGTASGDLVAHDRTTLAERWTAQVDGDDASVVAAEAFDDSVVVGERGPDGRIRCYDAATGERRWSYATAADVGDPAKNSRFFLPFIVAIESHRGRLYVGSRRYERADGERSFQSVVYAFEPDGDVAWTYETDASPITLDCHDDRVGVAFNRCTGTHQRGLVVLDADSGAERWSWDPGSDGQRRAGDVSLVPDGAVVASHGDYRGYRLRDGGTEEWAVDLATTEEVGEETLYAYPNHVHAGKSGVVFVTGNTYAQESRETESLHPNEHTAFGYTHDGAVAWTESVGGFASELGTTDETVVVPSAQHFRVRDAGDHGFSVFDVADGHVETVGIDGVVTAVDADADTTAAVEEPVVYHDEGTEHGAYRLHTRASRR